MVSIVKAMALERCPVSAIARRLKASPCIVYGIIIGLVFSEELTRASNSKPSIYTDLAREFPQLRS